MDPLVAPSSDVSPAASPPDPPELVAMRKARAEVANRRAEIAARASAAAQDPATLIAHEKIALAREMREAAVAEHNIKADEIYLSACVNLGDNKVARVRTSEGDIVLRWQTELEIDVAEARADAHRKRPAASPEEKVQQDNAARAATRAGLRSAVLTDLAHFDRVTGANKLLWTTLWRARNALVSAEAIDTGKDDAP